MQHIITVRIISNIVFLVPGTMPYSGLKGLLEGHENGAYSCQKKRIHIDNAYFKLHLEEYVANPVVMLHGNIKRQPSHHPTLDWIEIPNLSDMIWIVYLFLVFKFRGHSREFMFTNDQNTR